eukprot:3950316-Ditylum_brightwellii.AAC.1
MPAQQRWLAASKATQERSSTVATAARERSSMVASERSSTAATAARERSSKAVSTTSADGRFGNNSAKTSQPT